MARITGAENSIINRVVKNSDPAELLARIAQSNQFLKNESERQAKRDVVLQQRNANKGAQAISPTSALPTASAFSQEPGITAQNYADEVRRAELERLQQKALTELRRIENEAAYASTVEQADEIEKRRKAAEIELNAARSALRSVAPESIEYLGKERVANTAKGYSGQWLGSQASSLGTILAGGNALQDASSEEDRAINDSLYSGWVTDELTRQNFAEAGSESAGVLEENREAAQKVLDYADRTADRSGKQIMMAKENLGLGGQLAVDLGGQAIQIGLDALTGLPNLSLASRSFGGGAQEARQEGQDIGAQFTHGALQGAKEFALNKALGGISKVYGKSAVGKAFDGAFNKIIKNPVLASALGRIFNTEGIEEGLSILLDPGVKALAYKDVGLGEAYSELEIEDVLYNAAVGQLMGILGGGEPRQQPRNATQAQNAQNAPQQTQAAPLQETAPTPTESGTKPPAELNTQATRSVTDEVMEMLVPGISNRQAAAIMSDPEARAAFESLPNAPALKGTNSQQRGIIKDYAAFLAAQAQTEADSTAQTDPAQMLVDEALGQSAQASPATDAEAQPAAPTPAAPLAQPAQGQTTVPESGAATAAQGNGAMVPTQTNSSNPLYTAQERRIEGLRPEDSVHLRHTDQAVDNEVERRYTADKDGEKTYLFEGDRDWTDADTALAHRFLADAVAEARETGDYSEVVKLQREWERQGTRGGQALRQRSRFTATPEAIVAEAAEVLFGEDSQTRKKLKPQRKSEIMDKVADYANRFNEIPAGDTQAVVGMIKELSAERRTTGLFAKNISKTMNWALEQAASYPDGDAFLRDVLTTQIRSVAGDYAKPSAVNQIKQVRFLNMLSKLNTFARNIVANNILDPMETMSNNLAVPLDMLLSKFTGTRSVAVDKGWLSSAKRKGTTEGFIKSYIQVALDADTADVATKYEQRKGRTFKMTGGPLERLFSTWEMLEGFALKTTDEAQKGGIRAEAQRGIDKLKQDGKIADDALTKQADSIALERTLQNKGAASSTLTGIRSALNNTVLLRDEQGGELGLGEVLMPFANVPANATVKAAQYTPAGIIGTGRNLMQVLTAAKRGRLTPEMQARFVQSVGRSTMGVAMTALSCAIALKGLIKVAGSNDKDEEKALAAQGMKGTQINLSATYRWLSGGDPTWQDGDTLMDIGFAEQINANLAMGAALADEYKLDGDRSLGDIANANAEALLQAVLEMPAVSQISGMVDAYNYSDSETEGGKLADAAIDFLGSAATSFLIPNALRGIATGFDNTVRNTYASDSKVGQALDYALAGIPGLRNKLAPAVDNWGEEKTHTDNLLLNVLNANVLPGSISRFKESPLQKEMARLSESGIENIYPDRNAPNSITIDGAKYALTPEQKDAYLRESGNLAAEYYREFMQADIYADLDDELRGEILRDLRTLAESEAKQSFAAGLGLETESSTVSNLENPVEFIATRTAFNTAVDARDYGAIDALLETARELDPKAYKTFVESTGTQALLDAAKAGVDSQAYYAVNDIARSANDRRGGSGVSDADRLFGIANADISNRERDAIAKVLLGETLYGYYEKARDAGYSAKDAANIYSRADANGKNGVSQAEMDGYIQRTGASSEEAERLWALFGWKTPYSRYRPK